MIVDTYPDKISDKIKVLHFLPRWDNGGMEHAALNIVKYSNRDDIQYSFLVGFKKVRFNYLYENRVYSFRNVIEGINYYLSMNKPDIIHCHINNSIGLIFAAVARRQGIKRIIVHTHNNAFGTGHLKIKNILRIISLALFQNIPNVYLACSDEAGKWTFGNAVCKKNYKVVNNGVDFERFKFDFKQRTMTRAKFKVQDYFIIGHIGHFNFQKNQIFLVNMLPTLIKILPNVHLILIGSGETHVTIEDRVDELGIEEYVTFIEPVENVEDYYAMFDVFVLPSNFEGFGIVAVEAQASALPLICSDRVPIETRISEDAYYYPLEMPELWITKLVELEKNPIDRLKKINPSVFDAKSVENLIEAEYI